MAKYLFFTDAHVKGKNPASRTDNYYASWMLKFGELLMLAKKHKVDAIIDGGDLLDIPIVADSIVDDILDAIESAGIPFYVCWGNHPMIGHHKETSKGSTLSHMFRRCKLFKDIGGGEEVGKDYSIDFVDYDHNIEEKLKTEGIIRPENKANKDYWKIAIVHAFVTPKPFLPTVLHVVANDIKTNMDLVLVGHYHKPWTKKIGKTTFLDIGCFGRCKSDEADIEPSVLLLDTDKRSYEIIKLETAKKGSEVFDLSKKEHSEYMNEDLETFIASLKDFKSQETDLRGMIEHIGREQNIDRTIVEIVLNKLGEIDVQKTS